MKLDDETLERLAETLRPIIEKMVEEIIAAKTRKEPRFLESIRSKST